MILKEIDFLVQKKEFVAIIGSSGSGKSTLMNILGVLDRPDSGSYQLNDKDVSMLTEDEAARIRNQDIGFVFQSFYLLSRLTAVQNVMLPLFYRGMNKKDSEMRALLMLEKVGMRQHAHHRPNMLSGGQQQRIAIARALVGKPSLILADEPTGALDSLMGQEVMNFLIQLNQDEGTTIILITHDPNVAAQCQRCVKISDGMML